MVGRSLCQSTSSKSVFRFASKRRRVQRAAQAPEVPLGTTDQSVVDKLEEALAAASYSFDEADLRFTSPPPASPIERILASGPVLAYLAQLERHPLTTKCWTSFTGFFLGDVVAQLIQGDGFDISRTLILAVYGYLIDAPAGSKFYEWLDSSIEPGRPQSASAVGKKIAIDQLLYAPVFTCILYAYLQLAHGDAASIPDVLQAKVLPTLLANYAIWPFAHALNFYFVPTEQRILYNNFVAICWTTWLSCLAH